MRALWAWWITVSCLCPQALCLIGRAVNIFPLSFMLNYFREHKITRKMQFIMWFSGKCRRPRDLLSVKILSCSLYLIYKCWHHCEIVGFVLTCTGLWRTITLLISLQLRFTVILLCFTCTGLRGSIAFAISLRLRFTVRLLCFTCTGLRGSIAHATSLHLGFTV